MSSQSKTAGIATSRPGIENCSFIFDLKALLIDSTSDFATPKISAVTLNRLDYLGKLTGGAVAIISDREISKMIKILDSVSSNLVLVGSHGGETLLNGKDYSNSQPSETLDSVRAEITEFVISLKPVYLENKKLSIAVHFGAAPDLKHLIYKKLSKICKSLGDGFQLIQGHYFWELKETQHNKGLVISRLLETTEFRHRTAYFFGAHITDEPAFLMTNLRQGTSVYVGEPVTSSRAKFHLSNSNTLKNWIKELCLTQLAPSLLSVNEKAKRSKSENARRVAA